MHVRVGVVPSRCAQSPRVLNSNILVLIVSEIPAFIRTDGHGLVDSGWLVIVLKTIYTLWCRKHFLLPVTNFHTFYRYTNSI